MKTDSNFNGTRFAQYLSLDILRCVRKSGLVALACGLAPAMALACAAWTFRMTDVTDWTLASTFNDFLATIVSVLFFLIVPISCYGHLTDKRKGSAYLMLPASHAEKFTSMVVISIVVIPAAFAALYLSTDALCSLCFPSRYEGPLAQSLGEGLFSSFFLPCMVSSAGLAGAVLFKKSKNAKTFMTATLSFIAIVIIVVTIKTRTDILDRFADNLWLIWYLFQVMCTIGCLTYSYFKTKTIEL